MSGPGKPNYPKDFTGFTNSSKSLDEQFKLISKELKRITRQIRELERVFYLICRRNSPLHQEPDSTESDYAEPTSSRRLM